MELWTLVTHGDMIINDKLSAHTRVRYGIKTRRPSYLSQDLMIDKEHHIKVILPE